MIDPHRNRSEFVRECVREYPDLNRRVIELKLDKDISEADYKLLRTRYTDALTEIARLNDLLKEHSINPDLMPGVIE